MALPALCLGLLTFNRGERVLETLGAMVKMDRVGGRVARLIVIDNNSTDETGRIVDEFAVAHPEWGITRIVERVQGTSAARARFVREATEPYIALMDDDVLPDEGWAAAVVRTLDARPRAGWVGGKVELLWEAGPTGLAMRCRTMLAHQDFGESERRIERMDQGMVSAAFAARREALLEIGWLEHRMLGGREGAALECGEDYEMCVRLRQGGWEVWYTPEGRVRHQIPAKRQTVEYLAKLSRGVSLSKAQLKWLAEGKPTGAKGVEWARPQLEKARMKLTRSRLLEWRPGVRAIKIAEHEGRVESWERLLRELGG
jgi:GT2 family glycosyltransferase